jgi:hypothetical protein
LLSLLSAIKLTAFLNVTKIKREVIDQRVQYLLIYSGFWRGEEAQITENRNN